MSAAQEFTDWVTAKGVKINGVAIREYEGRGFGLVATKDLKDDETILTVPSSALHNIATVDGIITESLGHRHFLHQPNKPITVNGILAQSLYQLDPSWSAMLPKDIDLLPSLPYTWPPSLQALLPQRASSILLKQQKKIDNDYAAILDVFNKVSKDGYVYNWFLVSTRTFYWTAPSPPKSKGRKGPAARKAALRERQKEKDKIVDHDDCISLAPFADMFNHTPNGSVSVTFSSNGYTLNATQDIQEGDELSISYGNHNNDFLLVEYGFVIPGEGNTWDEVGLDEILEGLFSEEQKELIKSRVYWGKWVLDKEGVCYRTKVAVAALCVTAGRWERLVDSGDDGGETLSRQREDILREALSKYISVIEQTQQKIEQLTEGSDSQRAALKERWNQIAVFVNRFIESAS